MIEIFQAAPWQMTLGERSALEGVLVQLQPALAIEIGTAEGGSLRRIASHGAEVHSFDLVEPSLPVREWGNVHLHTGDSHRLLREYLAQLAGEGRNVDFVLVDGDHSADGVEQDVSDLLASPAIGRTIILVHDTSNDGVRRGVDRVAYERHDKVALVDHDFVAGHVSHGGDYHLAIWGGLGLIVVDTGATARRIGDGGFYRFTELAVQARDALRDAEASGISVAPGALPELHASATCRDELAAVHAELDAARRELDEARHQLEAARRGNAELTGSLSWRLTAPLREAKRLARQ